MGGCQTQPGVFWTILRLPRPNLRGNIGTWWHFAPSFRVLSLCHLTQHITAVVTQLFTWIFTVPPLLCWENIPCWENPPGSTQGHKGAAGFAPSHLTQGLDYPSWLPLFAQGVWPGLARAPCPPDTRRGQQQLCRTLLCQQHLMGSTEESQPTPKLHQNPSQNPLTSSKPTSCPSLIHSDGRH